MIQVTKNKKKFLRYKNLSSMYVLPSLKILALFSDDIPHDFNTNKVLLTHIYLKACIFHRGIINIMSFLFSQSSFWYIWILHKGLYCQIRLKRMSDVSQFQASLIILRILVISRIRWIWERSNIISTFSFLQN